MIPRYIEAIHCAAMSRVGRYDRGAEQGIRDQSEDCCHGRKHEIVEGRKTGLQEPRSTVHSEAKEAIIVAFLRHTDSNQGTGRRSMKYFPRRMKEIWKGGNNDR